jgi:hypothetical protein
MRDFAESARTLTKNPLGIIGLFIVLVYGFACLALGLSASQLDPSERSCLIWFIVLFPILILGVFYRLVTAHHKKLYAPSDYKDERLFLEPLSDERRAERLKVEVQRVEELEALEPSAPQTEKLRPAPVISSAYANAERLAFLALEQEIGKPFQKYVQLSVHGRKEEFDGVLITNYEAHLIEVKYFSRPTFKREFLEALIHRASSFVWDQIFKEAKDKVIFWIAIVVDFPREALPEFKKKVEDSVRCEFFTVNVRFYHLDDLKAKYG